MIIKSCGRKIKIKNGRKSQTLNIYTNELVHGKYDYIIRMWGRESFVDGLEIEKKNFSDINDLIQFLKEKHFGTVEEVSIQGDTLKIYEKNYCKEKGYHKHIDFRNDLWVKEAITKVELTLNNFLKKFMSQPYLHRVEHSIHCDLYNMLTKEDILNRRLKLGNENIQMIHKEWPEFIPRAEKENRLGNFDIAILSPNNYSGYNLNKFINGRIEAPIVIEMGLDYGTIHLMEDFKKLINSRVYKGYLIHFIRKEKVFEYKNLEKLLLEIEENNKNIRVGYVKHESSKLRYKLIGDNKINIIKT